MIRLLRGLVISYGIFSSLVLSFFLLHPVMENALGMTLSGRASAAFEALLEDPSLISEEVVDPSRAEVPDPSTLPDEKFTGDVNKLALDLRRELHQTSRSIDSWEDRLQDILKADIEENLEKIRRENEEVSQLGQNWARIRKNMVDLLNTLIRSKSQEHSLLEEDEFNDMVQGKTVDENGEPIRSIDQLLQMLRGNEAGLAERGKELEGLKAEVLAQMLAVEPEPAAAGTVDRKFLNLDQIVQLLHQMDARKRTKVFTALQEANPEKAAAVLTRFLTLGAADA